MSSLDFKQQMAEMVSVYYAREFDEALLTEVLDECIEDFPNMKALKLEQKMCDSSHRIREEFNISAYSPNGESVTLKRRPRLIHNNRCLAVSFNNERPKQVEQL